MRLTKKPIFKEDKMKLFNFTNKKNKSMEETKTMAKIDEIIKNLTEDERKELRARLKDDTTEQIKKAKEDISKTGRDSQTEKDRIDESVAAQERANGTRDSQTAKDRVDEAEGEDRELRRRTDDKNEAREHIAALREEMSKLREMITALNSKPVEVADEKAKAALNEAKQLYLN